MDDGEIRGSMMKSGTSFDIYGEATTSGITQSTAKVFLRGSVNGTSVKIEYSIHP